MSLEELQAKLRRYVGTNATLWRFRGNGLGPEEAKVVAEALRHNATVHTVNLSCNNMGPEGTKAVAEALRHNATVHTVNLSCNNMGPEGTKAVAEALRHNATVHTV
eukprot:EG_transcript_59594